MSLDLPDIEPYRDPFRRADPTDGALIRWAQADGIPVLETYWVGGGRLKDKARKVLMDRLGIPPRRSSGGLDEEGLDVNR